MPSDSGDRRSARPQNITGSQEPSKLAEPLSCPRCKSTNTKFCYYNNYNLSQPRHFCKGCRRYWTYGGTLRNVPIGGGTRKNSKRSRASSSTSTSSSSSTTTAAAVATTASTFAHESEILRLPANPDPVLPVLKADTTSDNSNFGDNPAGHENGNFISLNTPQGPGFMGMVGHGSSFGYGLCEMGLGYSGKAVLGYPGMGFIGGGDGSDMTWQVGDVGEASGLIDGDCFAWPGLAVSGPGEGLK